MLPTNSRIKRGEKILVTGANGYIASHVINILLNQGHNVRGTVRTEKPWLARFFDDRYGKGRFEPYILPVLDRNSAFDEAVKGVAGVIHIATDVSLNPNPYEVVPNAVAGTINILQSAAKESLMKSFVLTSSSLSALLPEPNKNGIVVTENSWNDAAVAAAYSKDTPPELLPYLVYCASKTESERVLWKWAKENNPSFVVNSVLPSLVMGPILTPEIPGSTMSFVRDLLEGKTERNIKLLPPQWHIDVRDAARLHVASLLDPGVQSERLFGFAGTHNWTSIIAILRKLRPNNTKIPGAPEDEACDLSDARRLSKRAERLISSFFGVRGWTNLETSLEDGIADLK